MCSGISPELASHLDTPCWYHGTDQFFDNLEFPPPPIPNDKLTVQHTAVFFTSNIDYAKDVGKNIAIVELTSSAHILDTTTNYSASEALREEVQKNYLVSLSDNIKHDYWHDGWKTGDVLRLSDSSFRVQSKLETMILKVKVQLGVPLDVARTIVLQNTTRGLIELICTSAKSLGYDALYGYEIDRHSSKNKTISQPWLAVLKSGMVTKPKWI